MGDRRYINNRNNNNTVHQFLDTSDHYLDYPEGAQDQVHQSDGQQRINVVQSAAMNYTSLYQNLDPVEGSFILPHPSGHSLGSPDDYQYQPATFGTPVLTGPTGSSQITQRGTTELDCRTQAPGMSVNSRDTGMALSHDSSQELLQREPGFEQHLERSNAIFLGPQPQQPSYEPPQYAQAPFSRQEYFFSAGDLALPFTGNDAADGTHSSRASTNDSIYDIYDKSQNDDGNRRGPYSTMLTSNAKKYLKDQVENHGNVSTSPRTRKAHARALGLDPNNSEVMKKIYENVRQHKYRQKKVEKRRLAIEQETGSPIKRRDPIPQGAPDVSLQGSTRVLPSDSGPLSANLSFDNTAGEHRNSPSVNRQLQEGMVHVQANSLLDGSDNSNLSSTGPQSLSQAQVQDRLIGDDDFECLLQFANVPGTGQTLDSNIFPPAGFYGGPGFDSTLANGNLYQLSSANSQNMDQASGNFENYFDYGSYYDAPR